MVEYESTKLEVMYYFLIRKYTVLIIMCILTFCYLEEEQNVIAVKVVDNTYKKPFLGGFKHKLTGVEYLNASCQTYSKKNLKNQVCI